MLTAGDHVTLDRTYRGVVDPDPSESEQPGADNPAPVSTTATSLSTDCQLHDVRTFESSDNVQEEDQLPPQQEDTAAGLS